MILLGVNIDHVATIREARKIDYPDPVEAALSCEKAGADSIVCHLREDRRHIQDRDLYELKKNVNVKLNLEMAMAEEIINIALRVKPDQVTFVPERRRELTTEGGLDVVSAKKSVKRTVEAMQKNGIAVSLFVDPDREQIEASRETGAKMIEIHTGCYANAKSRREVERQYRKLDSAAKFAKKLGLRVFAGHGLNYGNVRPLKRIKEFEEYNIGHSIVARSIFVGLEKAVREMKKLLI